MTAPSATRLGMPPVEAISRWHRLGAATHRRAGRIEWIVFALVVLLPPLVFVLMGGD